MCLIVFDWNPNGTLPLRLVANRDEFHARPTQSLHFWPDEPDILAGRDMQAGGTWLGVSRNGRMAAITNVRETGITTPDPQSRGHLVRDFLREQTSVTDYLQQLQQQAQRYPGFNLLLLADGEMWHYSNRSADSATQIAAGVHGLSNAGLDTPWPKLVQARNALSQLPANAPLDHAVDVTARRERFADGELPDTGVGLELERLLSPPFIVSPNYGTRCTTAIRMSTTNAEVLERRYDPQGNTSGQSENTVVFSSLSATRENDQR